MALARTPIKQRLTLVILISCLTVLMLTTTAFLIYELIASSDELKRNVDIAGRIIAAQSTAPLMYQGNEEAREILSSLSEADHIVAAALYDTNGTLFASYPPKAPTNDIPSRPPEPQRKLTWRELIWCQPVKQNERWVGTLLVKSNLAPVYDRIQLYTLIGLLILAGSFLVAFFLSNQLQKSISRPILDLAATARAVSEQRDYSVRARKLSEDELGLLVDAFNHMLGQIAHRETALRDQAELLDLANVLARDLEDRIILWSAGMEQLYGWSKAEALGKVSHELLGTEFPQPAEAIKAKVLREREWSGELVHHRRGGQRVTVASHWVLHNDERGLPAAVLEVNNDITERKLAEEEVRRLNARLEERVRERTAELTNANRELEAFTYTVSHDLRAPLRHIDAFARIVEEELSPAASASLRNYIDRIRKGTQTMGRLVDDLLNLSRVGRAQLGWEPVDLNSVLAEVLADLKAETINRQIEWRISRLPRAHCDTGLMKQVFTNLLSNAVKYTSPRERAIIEVGCDQFDGQHVVHIRDNGVGFNMKYVNKLFGVFERLHRPEEFEGTGIGLAIVRRIIQKHGGRVWAEAEPDKGATFYFTLPEMQEEAAGSENSTHTT